MRNYPFPANRAILPMNCGACASLVRLTVSAPARKAVRQVWTCQVCGAENAVRAKWLVLKVLPEDVSPSA